jgi:hypothetical protein
MNEDLNEQVVEDVIEEVLETEQEEQVVEKEPERVPLATLLEEKKRRKELEKRLRVLEEKELDTEVISTREKIKQKYISKGYAEDLAESLAEDFAELKGELRRSKVEKKDYLDEEIDDLARDSFYSDAAAFKKEIKAKLKEFSDKGVTLEVEDAYNLVRSPKAKLREVKEDKEQKDLVKRASETKKTIVPNATGASPKNPYPLDDTDKKALAHFQKLYPEGGWTAEKYYNIRHK